MSLGVPAALLARLQPIEGAFSKRKAFCAAKLHAPARTCAHLEAAIAAGLATITPEDALGWFKHCGYLSRLQLS